MVPMQAPVTCLSEECAKGENAVSLVLSVSIQLSALSIAWILIINGSLLLSNKDKSGCTGTSNILEKTVHRISKF